MDLKMLAGGVSLLVLLLLIPLASENAYAYLPLGSVVVTDPHESCSNGLECEQLEVSCPGAENIAVTLEVSTPPGPLAGTIALHAGAGGTAELDPDFQTAFNQDHFRTIEIVWASDWENTGNNQSGNILTAACRPATVFNWIYGQYVTGTNEAYCALGNSAGSAAIAYSLVHYGLGSGFDAAMLSAGPPMANLVEACTAPITDTVEVCPADTGTVNFPAGSAGARDIDAADHTTTCGTGDPPLQDIAVWTNSSVDTPPGIYDYPDTVLSGFDCPKFNAAAGNGTFFWNQVTSTVSTIQCDNSCPNEEFYYTTANFNKMVDQMETDCVPRH